MKRTLHRLGIEVRRFDPQASLDLLVDRLLDDYSIDRVIDVGANIGQAAISIRNQGFDGEIFSFEPDPTPYEQLLRNSAHDELWTVSNLALGSKNEQKELQVRVRSDLTSFLSSNPDAADRAAYLKEADPAGVVTTDVVTLDSIFTNDGVPTFLKIDTQGWDLEVLNGAKGVLDTVPLIMTELAVIPTYDAQPGYLTTIGWLDKMGFTLAGMYPIVRDHSWALIEADGVFVRTDRGVSTVPHTNSRSRP